MAKEQKNSGRIAKNRLEYQPAVLLKKIVLRTTMETMMLLVFIVMIYFPSQELKHFGCNIWLETIGHIWRKKGLDKKAKFVCELL